MKNIIKKWLGIDTKYGFEKYFSKEGFRICEECFCLCQSEKSRKITIASSVCPHYNYKFFCRKCGPKYDIEFHNKQKETVKYYKNEVEVDINGKPICTKI